MSIMLPLVPASWALSEPLNNVKKIGLSLDSCLIALQFPADCSDCFMDVLAVINELLNHHVLFWGKPIPTVIYLKTVLQIILHFSDEHLGCQCSKQGMTCQHPLTLASTSNLGMEILVWGADLSFIPCGLGLCTVLSGVNWQWFQNLLGSRSVPQKLSWILWSFLMH